MSQETHPRNSDDNRVIGVVDIGSNSVRLLVCRIANGQALPLYTDLITSRLLSNISGSTLAPESIDRTIAAIERLVATARDYAADRIIAFGTCAMREGVNSRVIIDAARLMGVEIEVLSGEEEARMAYIGASELGKNGIIDIGGGSTELIVGENDAIIARASAPVGAVRLYEGARYNDPAQIVSRAADILAPAWEAVARQKGVPWTGVGGTITTLAALSLKLEVYSPKRVCGYVISRDEAREWLHRLCGMSTEDREALAGMKKNRADIIPFGAAILVAFFNLSNAESINVTENDNMLGYLKLKLGLNGN